MLALVLFVNFIALFPLFGFSIESFKWLIEKGKIESALRVFYKISKVNGKRLNKEKMGEFEVFLKKKANFCGKKEKDNISDLEIEFTKNQIPEIQKNDQKLSLNYEKSQEIVSKKILSQNRKYWTFSIIVSTIAISFVMFSVNSIYVGISISLTQIGSDSPQLNGIFFGLTQAVGYLLIYYLAPYIKRVKPLFITQILLLLPIGILGVLDQLDNKKFEFILIIKTGIALIWTPIVMSINFIFYFLIIAECFPVMIRGTVSSISLLTGKLMVIAVPSLIAWFKSMGFEPLIGAGLPILLSLPLTLLIKEK